jgi:hypothetical protein
MDLFAPQVRHTDLLPLVSDLGPGETEAIALGLGAPRQQGFHALIKN